MIRFQRIVCPTDFSDLAAVATRYARSLAEAYQAELHVIHVVDEAYQYWMAMGPDSLPIGPAPREVAAAARQQMERWNTAQFEGLATPVVSDVLLGQPFVEIIRYARDKQADLIVMGTHGRGGLTHVLLGSVTEKVVRKSPCPVLTVRDPGHQFQMP
ncbi:MAG: universal stress protein [Phycisphaerae bacterium]